MLELLFLLLPIAAAYGWFMGQRSARKEKDEKNNEISRAYVTGVDYLLENKPDKAVDLFLNILQKQESEEIHQPDTLFEAELTLGNLFRSRGEVDRALRIHQALNDSDDYTFEQKLLAKQHLAKDFLSVGFFDRAESIYITLVDEPNFAPDALQQLMLIYQRTKDWSKAINAAEKRLKILPQDDPTALAHYYCEYALQLTSKDKEQSVLFLKKALSVSPNCVRASLILGDIEIAEKNYKLAISYLEKILTQNPDFIAEALPLLHFCYTQIDQLQNFEPFLIQANKITQSSAVKLMLVDLIQKTEGVKNAQSHLYQDLVQLPDLLVFHRFIQYQIDEAEEGSAKNSLILLHNMVGKQIKQNFEYKCHQCGFKSHKLFWCCPSCRHWETIKPIQGTLQHQI